MDFSFLYDKEALLEFQLYLASKSATIKKSRNRNRLLLTVVLLFMGAMYIYRTQYPYAAVFIGMAVLWYLAYPKLGGRIYKKHFTKFVDSSYANRLGEEVKLSFGEHELSIEEKGSTAGFAYEEFAEMAEIPSSFLIKLKTDMVIVIQKNATVSQEEIAAFLDRLSKQLNISFSNNTNWKWQ